MRNLGGEEVKLLVSMCYFTRVICPASVDRVKGATNSQQSIPFRVELEFNHPLEEKYLCVLKLRLLVMANGDI